MVVDQFTRKECDGLGIGTLGQQIGHPLLEQGGFADLPPPAQGENTRCVYRQLQQDLRSILVGLPVQAAQVGVLRDEIGRIFQMSVVGKKSGVHGSIQ